MAVYFIRAGEDGPIKIGYTGGEIGKRLRALQCVSPLRLTLLATCEGSKKTEKRLHCEFRRYRLWGEWFRAAAELLELAQRVRDGGHLYPQEHTELTWMLELVRSGQLPSSDLATQEEFTRLFNKFGFGQQIEREHPEIAARVFARAA